MGNVPRKVRRPRLVPVTRRVDSRELIGVGNRYRSQNRAEIVVIFDEFVRQVGQQRRIDRLRIELVQIDVVRWLDDAQSEHFFPEIVARRS